MSDPVTNVEIEDVLSSIRRLVSVDGTRTVRKIDDGTERGTPDELVDQGDTPLDIAPEPAVETPKPRPEGKLVLTSDLRVKPGTPPAAEIAASAAMRSDTDALKRRIAELEAAVGAQTSDFEPDGSEDAAQHRPSAMLRMSHVRANAAGDGTSSAEDADELGAQDASVGDTNIDAFIRHEVQDVAYRMSTPEMQDGPEGLSAGPGDRTDAPPEDGCAAGPSDDDLLSHLKAAQGDDALYADRASQDTDDTIVDEIPTTPDEGRDASEPEVLDAERRGSHPFNAAGMDGALGSVVGSGLTLADDRALIDEEALREMVSEIVRQELQGALGERITRNVRKLVRREIMRAISIRDFD